MAHFEHKTCRVHYDVQGEGPDLLFMHGQGADRQQIQRSLAYLQGYRLITLDMPGHGESQLPAQGDDEFQPGFVGYSGIAKALLCHLGIRRTIVGGISIGACIALHMALTDQDLVDVMVLVQPAWLSDPATPQIDLIADIGLGSRRGGVKAVAHSFDKFNASKKPLGATSIKKVSPSRPKYEATDGFFEQGGSLSFAGMKALGKCQVPGLIIGSEADPIHGNSIARAISDALPGGEYFEAPSKHRQPHAYQVALETEIQRYLTLCFKIWDTPNSCFDSDRFQKAAES